MICPRCQQQAEGLADEGRCPYCQYPLADYHRQITMVQVVLGVLFSSTLAYGVVVAVMELVVEYTPPAGDISANVLGGALIAASLMPVALLRNAARRKTESGDSAAMKRGLMMMAAAAEAPAVSGLAVYFVTGSLMWFAILLGVSWLLFLRLGMDLPQYLNTIRDTLGRE